MEWQVLGARRSVRVTLVQQGLGRVKRSGRLAEVLAVDVHRGAVGGTAWRVGRSGGGMLLRRTVASPEGPAARRSRPTERRENASSRAVRGQKALGAGGDDGTVSPRRRRGASPEGRALGLGPLWVAASGVGGRLAARVPSGGVPRRSEMVVQRPWPRAVSALPNEATGCGRRVRVRDPVVRGVAKGPRAGEDVADAPEYAIQCEPRTPEGGEPQRAIRASERQCAAGLHSPELVRRGGQDGSVPHKRAVPRLSRREAGRKG